MLKLDSNDNCFMCKIQTTALAAIIKTSHVSSRTYVNFITNGNIILSALC